MVTPRGTPRGGFQTQGQSVPPGGAVGAGEGVSPASWEVCKLELWVGQGGRSPTGGSLWSRQQPRGTKAAARRGDGVAERALRCGMAMGQGGRLESTGQ